MRMMKSMLRGLKDAIVPRWQAKLVPATPKYLPVLIRLSDPLNELAAYDIADGIGTNTPALRPR